MKDVRFPQAMKHGSRRPRNNFVRTFIFLTSTWRSIHDHTFIANVLKVNELHTFMYRNYNSAEELRLTLQELKPVSVVPLVESDKPFLKEFLKEQYSEVIDDSESSPTQYWNHLSGLDKIFQYQSFTDHAKVKANASKFQLSGTESLQNENYLVNNFKIRPCSVVIRKLSSKEIEKYCHKHIDVESVNCHKNVSTLGSASKQLEDKTTIKGINKNEYFDKTKILSNSSFDKDSFNKPDSDSNKSSIDHNIGRELRVQLVDIFKESKFLEQFNLMPKWKVKNSGEDKV